MSFGVFEKRYMDILRQQSMEDNLNRLQGELVWTPFVSGNGIAAENGMALQIWRSQVFCEYMRLNGRDVMLAFHVQNGFPYCYAYTQDDFRHSRSVSEISGDITDVSTGQLYRAFLPRNNEEGVRISRNGNQALVQLHCT